MIYDNLKNCETYFGANDKFEKAFAFIKTAVAENYPVGRYDIDGEDLYAMVQEYNTNLLENAKFEGHKHHIDIQYIVSGEEMMKVINVSKVSPNTEYNAEKDCVFFANPVNASAVLVQPGEYAIFFPEDIHMPGVAPDDKPAAARKIVVKVKV